MASSKESISIAENPLAGGSLTNWLRLARANGPIERKYLARAVYITVMTVIWSPLRLAQRMIFGRRIERTEIRQGPLFILGHYRSGTTFLQNLITQDPQWGFVSTTQAVLPEMFLLGGAVRGLLRLFLPEKRPMDNMEMAPELPEEPEHAVGNLSVYCFYHGFCFPRRMMDYFRTCVLFEGVGPETVAAWKDIYRRVLQAATLAFGGKRLLVKNPADTARIPHLLEMFPDAAFIYLYRDPYVMYPSIRNFYSANIRDWKLHDISDEDLAENIFTIYARMIERYERDKGLVPAGRLVEVRFEDFEERPLEELERIYQTLAIPGFEEARDAFTAYIASQSGYQKNRYRLDDALAATITERWSDDIARRGYGKPEGI